MNLFAHTIADCLLSLTDLWNIVEKFIDLRCEKEVCGAMLETVPS